MKPYIPTTCKLCDGKTKDIDADYCNACWELRRSLQHASMLAGAAREEVRNRVWLMLAQAIAGMAP